jgi:hypothetical protein
LVDIEMGMLCFVDKYGRFSLKEAQWSEDDEERGTDSYGSASFENTPSPPLIPSVERSISGSSSNDLSVGSPGSLEEVISTRAGPSATKINEASRPAPSKREPGPGPGKIMEPTKSPAPGIAQSSFIPGISTGTPPPKGRFFNNPVNLRTLMTGSGDGYRSPEPPSRSDTFSPLHIPREPQTFGGGPTNPRPHLPGAGTGQPGPTFYTQPAPLATQSSSNPGLGMGYGYGSLPPSSRSSVLPPELVAYNDLMVDIGIAQYLGTGMRDVGSPPSVHPSMPPGYGGGTDSFGSNVNGDRLEGFSQHTTDELLQTISPFEHSQLGQLHVVADHASAQRAGSGFEGQWPTGGTVDYK